MENSNLILNNRSNPHWDGVISPVFSDSTINNKKYVNKLKE